jgi:hypothetical protein
MSKDWMRNERMRIKCGGISPRALARGIEEGRYPPPEFPFGNAVAAWREDKVDAFFEERARQRAGEMAANPPRPDPEKAERARYASRVRTERARQAREAASAPQAVKPGRRRDRAHSP